MTGPMITVRSTAHGRVLVRSTDAIWVERQLRFLDREKIPYRIEEPQNFERIKGALPGDRRG